MKQPPKFLCIRCGTTFAHKSNRSRQKYCSYACSHAAHRFPPEVIREHARAAAQAHHALYRQSYSAHVVAWRKELRRRAVETRRADRAAALDLQKAETKARFAASAAHRRARGKAWRLANPGRMRVLVRAWKHANPAKVRAARRGRSSKSNVRRRAWLLKVQKGRCAICRERLGAKTEIDHVIPRALGGANRRSNLQLTCVPCNQAKSAHHPVDFMRSRGLLL